MGQAKNKMIDDQINDDLSDFLKQLIDREELTGATLNGIAKQVVSKGVNSLSVRQRAVLDNFITTYKTKNTCERCENDNINDLIDYIHVAEDGICPTCENDYERFMRN